MGTTPHLPTCHRLTTNHLPISTPPGQRVQAPSRQPGRDQLLPVNPASAGGLGSFPSRVIMNMYTATSMFSRDAVRAAVDKQVVHQSHVVAARAIFLAEAISLRITVAKVHVIRDVPTGLVVVVEEGVEQRVHVPLIPSPAVVAGGVPVSPVVQIAEHDAIQVPRVGRLAVVPPGRQPELIGNLISTTALSLPTESGTSRGPEREGGLGRPPALAPLTAELGVLGGSCRPRDEQTRDRARDRADPPRCRRSAACFRMWPRRCRCPRRSVREARPDRGPMRLRRAAPAARQRPTDRSDAGSSRSRRPGAAR